MYPQTIESLEIREPLLIPGEDPDFNCAAFFKSLTALKFLLIEARDDRASGYMQPGLVEILNDHRLSEFHLLISSGDKPEFELGYEAWQKVRELREQAKEIRIYFNGLRIDCLPHLLNKSGQQDGRKTYPQTNCLTERDQRDFYLSNSWALCKLRSTSPVLPFYRVDYNLIDELSGDALDFFSARRMPRLQSVVLSEPVSDEPAFGRWLSESNALYSIVFERPQSPEFYSSILPASCPNLDGLTMVFRASQDYALDYSFLLKLKWLYRVDFSTSDYGLVERLFANLLHLRYLAFYDLDARESLVVVKRGNKKHKDYGVYDGRVEYCLRFDPVYWFEFLEGLVEFMKSFEGF